MVYRSIVLALFVLLGLAGEVQAQCSGQPPGNTVCAAPNAAAGVPRFRSLVTGDIPAGFVNAGTGLTGGAVTGGGTIAADIATTAQFEAATANKLLAADKVFTAEVAITFSATPTFDFSTFINASITLTANITSITFSNLKAGQSGLLRFIQSGAGSFTIPSTVNTNLKCAGGCNYVLTTGSTTASDILPYTCLSATYCVGGALLKDVK